MNLAASIHSATGAALSGIFENNALASAVCGKLGRLLRSGVGAGLAAIAIAMPAIAQDKPAPDAPAPAPAPAEALGNPKSAGSVLRVATQEEFDRIVLGSSKPVVLILKTDWCPVCKRLAKVTKDAAARGAEGFAIVEVDADRSPAIYNQWRGKRNAVPQIQVVSGGARTSMGVSAGGMAAAEFGAYLAKARIAESRQMQNGSAALAQKTLAAAGQGAVPSQARQARRVERPPVARPVLAIRTMEDFESMVLGAKIPVVVIFKNDDSISSNRMVKKAMKALLSPGPAYALALVDHDCADEEIHEAWASYSSYPELMAFSGGQQWDMDQAFDAGELSESQYGAYLDLLAKVSSPAAAKSKAPKPK